MQPHERQRGIIFDFDGVLADSFHCLYEVVRAAFATIGLLLTPEEYRALFLQNVKRAERERIGDDRRFQEVQAFIQEQVPIAYEHVRLFEGVEELISRLRDHADLVIVSSTAAPVIRRKLAVHHLDGHFAAILGAERAASKREKLGGVISTFGWDRDAVCFVSDTVGDLREGREVGLRTIGVTWGFHARDLLATAAPDHIASTRDDLFAHVVSGTSHAYVAGALQ